MKAKERLYRVGILFASHFDEGICAIRDENVDSYLALVESIIIDGQLYQCQMLVTKAEHVFLASKDDVKLIKYTEVKNNNVDSMEFNNCSN